MELFITEEHILVKSTSCILVCDRSTSQLTTRKLSEPWVASQLDGLSCSGLVHGLIGKIHNEQHLPFLLLIAEQAIVGQLPLGCANTNKPSSEAEGVVWSDVCRITRVVAIPINNNQSITNQLDNEFDLASLRLRPCELHHATGKSINESKSVNSIADLKLQSIKRESQQKLKSTFDSFMSVTSSSSSNLSNLTAPQATTPDKTRESSRRNRSQSPQRNQKVLDAILDMFNEQRCFYYCPNGDLTCSLQRFSHQQSEKTKDADWSDSNQSILDDRFFWNEHAISDLLVDENDETLTESPIDNQCFVRPIIQGFFKQLIFEFTLHKSITIPVKMSLVSRRSRHRAGTRYIKRGVDENADCANFVETEQIIEISGHCLSFLQVRGSIPVFWSQRGYKYRPVPRIERTELETLPVFQAHFNQLVTQYKQPILAVNLVDQTGRERQLGEYFLQNILETDSQMIEYVAFDYHEHCRGLRMDKVNVLLNTMQQSVTALGFTWLDEKGQTVSSQEGVLRVNCVDCLDRTNVVQAAFAQSALQQQLQKLGMLPSCDDCKPTECRLPLNIVKVLSHVWADNGDAISLQYAGTAALKGDVTRSGQRNLAGMMRDGLNSASRYYLCHTRDAQRQAAIDCLLGIEQEAVDVDPDKDPDVNLQHEELRQLVQDCQRDFLTTEQTQALLGAWAMVDAENTKDCTRRLDVDMNVVVMLTRLEMLVARYDHITDKFTSCECVPLASINQLLCGPLPAASLSSLLTTTKNQPAFTCLRVLYQHPAHPGVAGFSFTWRPAGTRLFNNMALPLRSRDDADEYVRAIGEQFVVACTVAGITDQKVHLVGKLERTKSKEPASPNSRSFTNLTGNNKNYKLSSAVSNFTTAGIRSFKNLTNRNNNNDTEKVEETLHLDLADESLEKQNLPDTISGCDSPQSGTQSPRNVLHADAGLLFHSSTENEQILRQLDQQKLGALLRSVPEAMTGHPNIGQTPAIQLQLVDTNTDTQSDQSDDQRTNVAHGLLVSQHRMSVSDSELHNLGLNQSDIQVNVQHWGDQSAQGSPKTERAASTQSKQSLLNRLGQLPSGGRLVLGKTTNSLMKFSANLYAAGGSKIRKNETSQVDPGAERCNLSDHTFAEYLPRIREAKTKVLLL